MAFRDDVLRVLSGGIPALVDGPTPAGTTAATPQRVEAVPPEPQLQDREPFALSLGNIRAPQILTLTVLAVAAIGLFGLIRR